MVDSTFVKVKGKVYPTLESGWAYVIYFEFYDGSVHDFHHENGFRNEIEAAEICRENRDILQAEAELILNRDAQKRGEINYYIH